MFSKHENYCHAREEVSCPRGDDGGGCGYRHNVDSGGGGHSGAGSCGYYGNPTAVSISAAVLEIMAGQMIIIAAAMTAVHQLLWWPEE